MQPAYASSLRHGNTILPVLTHVSAGRAGAVSRLLTLTLTLALTLALILTLTLPLP